MSDEFLVTAVETRAMAALESWARRRPGRGWKLEFIDGKWKATLADFVEASGASVADALAQIAQVAVMENEEPAT